MFLHYSQVRIESKYFIFIIVIIKLLIEFLFPKLFDTAPVGTPQEFVITAVDFTNVTLQWAPVECSQQNGPIDGYRITYYITYYKLNNKGIIIPGGGIRTFNIAGLQPRINYTFTIEAINQNYTSFGPHARTTVVMSVPNSMSTIL